MKYESWPTTAGGAGGPRIYYAPKPELPPMLAIRKQAEKQPRFGWGWDGHAAIETAAIRMLPASPFRQLLENQMDVVHLSSVNQDRYKIGPGHFLHVDDVRFPDASAAGDRKSYPVINRAFRSSELKPRTETLERKPLREAEVHHHANVFNTLFEKYDEVVGLLRRLKTTPAGPEKNELTHQLAETVGEMAHYAGDLHQPMHATRHYNWATAFPWMDRGRGGKSRQESKTHRYFERALFRPHDYDVWQAKLAARNPIPPAMNLAGLKTRLLDGAQKAYLDMFAVVKTDRDARREKNPRDYFARLQEGWKPLAAKQMNNAAYNLAILLNSAFEAAGKPAVAPGPKVRIDPALLRDY